MKKVSLSERADRIIASNPGLLSIKPVIEKELIHYDIFFLLQQQKLVIPNMVFIGGTCLRLCYGSNRYSEDLDFHAGIDFKPSHFDAIRESLENYLSDRYGLHVEVKKPKQISNSSTNTWKIIINTHPERKDVPAQRIHIDIANIPTHDAVPQLIRTNYAGLPSGYDTMVFKCSSTQEILADKLIAVAARNNIKARDLWDIIWLMQRNTQINFDLIIKKIADHKLENYKTQLENIINRLPIYFETGQFQQEMMRFLDSNYLTNTIQRPDFITYMTNQLDTIFKQVYQRIFSNNTDKTEFIL